MLSGEAFGLLGVALGFELGVVLDGFDVSPPMFAPCPRPLTVRRSTTLRLPAYECAMRRAV